MGIKTKTFDCIASKRQAQRRLREEYEKRTGEFDSYVDFINAKVHENEWARQMWERFPPANSDGQAGVSP